MITTATDKLMVMASTKGTAERSGRLHSGIPGSTADKVAIPQVCKGRYLDSKTPSAIKTTAIGNFGMIFLDSKRIHSAKSPKSRDGTFNPGRLSHKCKSNSGNSPVPALPPKSFGACIRMIVVQIPVIKPPMTGAEM